MNKCKCGYEGMFEFISVCCHGGTDIPEMGVYECPQCKEQWQPLPEPPKE